MPYEPVQGRLHYIFEKYGISPLGDITISFCSMANEIFSFDTEEGKLYLKNCLKNDSPSRIALEIAFSEHLQENGMPCPELVSAKNGDKVVYYNGFQFLLSKAFDGYTPHWNDTLEPWIVRETMRGLGRFHQAAASFSTQHDSDRIKSFEFERQSAWLDDLQAELTEQSDSEPNAGMLQLIPKLRHLIESVRPHVAEGLARGCQVQMIHGDFHCFNVFYKDEQMVGCCDFDFIRRDLRLFDLWWCTRSMLDDVYFPLKWGAERVRDRQFQPDPDEIQPIINAAIRECIEFYRQCAELSDTELSFLPLMPKLLILNNMQFFDPNSSEEERADHVTVISQQLRKIEAHSERLKTAVDQMLSGVLKTEDQATS
ncbi:phosphotransferase enzyme family protein [Corallincola platygyrae]|uniref:Phosphotransferase enzyme family protein n=1 Tax=Corallincola platygyrae TaxID=1193278 RepID=A0ABW4XNT2_9GAMM